MYLLWSYCTTNITHHLHIGYGASANELSRLMFHSRVYTRSSQSQHKFQTGEPTSFPCKRKGKPLHYIIQHHTDQIIIHPNKSFIHPEKKPNHSPPISNVTTTGGKVEVCRRFPQRRRRCLQCRFPLARPRHHRMTAAAPCSRT
jgi:hypothetical protein